MKKLLLSLLALPLLASAANIHMAGDSTMANYPAKCAPLTGWGMKMQDKCVEGVRVYNCAISGTSSKTFRTPEDQTKVKFFFWDRLLNRVKMGDFVIIQFGINDAARGYRHADPKTDFQTNLKGFIADVRAKGATPVLCTQIVTCRVHKKGHIYIPTKNKMYIDAVKKVAAETNCPVIDLNGESFQRFKKMGVPAAEKLYMMDAAGRKDKNGNVVIDRTHLNAEGADFYAALFVELAKAQNLSIGKLLK